MEFSKCSIMRQVLFSILLCLVAWQANAGYDITGTVKDQDGDPLVGAIIKISDTYFITTTDSDGKYAFKNVDEGSYTISVDMIGYKTISQAFDLKKNAVMAFEMQEDIFVANVLIVRATRTQTFSPIAQETIQKEALEDRNLGQDLPILLNYSPSVVTTSDAGAGVGYTGIRVRGSDATRINVTVNGVPINDSESQGTFWVNMPDFVSSTNSIQIQRGVGTSTNGAGAFGATINLQTTSTDTLPYAEINNSFGSFNTHKHTVLWGTGLINNRWSIDGRVSGIFSDGYIDNASADLRSYYLTGSYYGKKTSLKFITFAGKERTYQSWWGTPEAVLNGNMDDLLTHYNNNLGSTYNTVEDSLNLFNSGRTYNYYTYEDEVDNYQQDHYQLHLTHNFNKHLNLHAALHYTYGRGYFEQFKYKEDISDYGVSPLPGDSTDVSDVIRRRWLDNHFYGATFALNYSKNRLNLVVGGAGNQYLGDHFGELVWMEYAGQSDIYDRYYDNTATKTDANIYAKAHYALDNNMLLFFDAQVRNIQYTADGPDADGRIIDVDADYTFFNPKAGITWLPSSNQRVYASIAIANREPVRNDFVDADSGKIPEHESLMDIELGYSYTAQKFAVNANLFFMDYKNQLVLTGELNDVGSSVRRNVPDSYRAGLELWGDFALTKKLSWRWNFTYSMNKIKSFTETLYDYGNGTTVLNTYEDTDISFSPNVIAGSGLAFKPAKGLELVWFTKYVGEQFLDNTSSDSKKIDAYLVNDLVISYSIKPSWVEEIGISLMVNNILNEMYSSNGYTYSYIFGDTITENFYYPQAGINFLAGLSVRF